MDFIFRELVLGEPSTANFTPAKQVEHIEYTVSFFKTHLMLKKSLKWRPIVSSALRIWIWIWIRSSSSSCHRPIIRFAFFTFTVPQSSSPYLWWRRGLFFKHMVQFIPIQCITVSVHYFVKFSMSQDICLCWTLEAISLTRRSVHQCHSLSKVLPPVSEPAGIPSYRPRTVVYSSHWRHIRITR